MLGRDRKHSRNRCMVDGTLYGYKITDDGDADGIPDCAEATNGLDPTVGDDALLDTDEDGLINRLEFQHGTGYFDEDSDDDNLLDGIEVQQGTDPQLADSDHDGLDDDVELARQYDPHDPAEGMLDSDGDNYSNREEGLAGSDPFDAQSKPMPGTTAWTIQIGEVTGAPAIAPDGTVYVGSRDWNLYALFPDGLLKWSYLSGGQIRSSPAIDAEGTVYFVAEDGNVYAITSTGAEKWIKPTEQSTSVSGEHSSSVAIAQDGIHLYVYASGNIIKFRKSDGQLLESKSKSHVLRDSLKSSPALNSDTIYIGVDGANQSVPPGVESLLAINQDPFLSTRHVEKIGGINVDSSPAIGPDGSVYIGIDGSFDGSVVAIDADDEFKWRKTFDNGAEVHSPVIGENGIIYALTGTGVLQALDPSDGSELWVPGYAAGSGTFGSPAIGSDGTIYFGTRLGFHAVNNLGQLVWSTPSSRARTPVIDNSDGLIIYAARGEGSTDGYIIAAVDETYGHANSSWPMFRHDPQHTGQANYSTPNTIPLVVVESPVNGTTFAADSSITFVGTAGDVEDGPLNEAITWSSDVVGSLGSPGGTLTISTLPVGPHAITASVIDSEGLPGSDAISITVVENGNTNPTVSITSPGTNSTFTQGNAVNFLADATDSEDGALTGSSIVWTSDKDGQIGTGTVVNTSTLTVDTHTITVTATDSGGLNDDDSIVVTIIPTGSNNLPTVSISTPTDDATFNESDTITFIAAATDVEDDDTALSDTITWTSTIDGVLGTGASVQTMLSAGSHMIMAKVTDSGGEMVSDVVSITVQPGGLSLEAILMLLLD